MKRQQQGMLGVTMTDWSAVGTLPRRRGTRADDRLRHHTYPEHRSKHRLAALRPSRRQGSGNGNGSPVRSDA